jgi:hypothetical protein
VLLLFRWWWSDHTLFELTNIASSNNLTNIGYNLGNLDAYSFFVVSGFAMAYVYWSNFRGPRAGVNCFGDVLFVLDLYTGSGRLLGQSFIKYRQPMGHKTVGEK